MKESNFKSMDDCVDQTKLDVYQVITDATPLILFVNISIAALLYTHWQNTWYSVCEGGLVPDAEARAMGLRWIALN